MDDGPLKNFWEECNGVEINKETRDSWVDETLQMLKNSKYSFVRSGSSAVFAFDFGDDEGSITILDCVVKRTAKVNKYDQR